MNYVRIENLMKADLTEKRVEKIKKAVKGAVKRTIGGEFEKYFSLDDISFTFPDDRTVTSESIPIAIEVCLIFNNPSNGFYRNELAKQIWASFKATVIRWRKLGKVKVKVDFMGFDTERGGWFIG